MLCDLLRPVRTAARTGDGASGGCGGGGHRDRRLRLVGDLNSSRAAPARSVSVAKPAIPTVLVLTQTLGYRHMSIPTAIVTVRSIAARSGRYRVVSLASATQLTPAALRHAAAVMFLLTTGELPMNAADKRALVAFIRDGGGLIGFHSATDTFHDWATYEEMIGAEFSHHPHPSTQRVIVTDHSTPPRTRSPRAS